MSHVPFDVDHSVILFGGRISNEWSNVVYKVQLRPEYENNLKEIKAQATRLDATITRACDKWQEEPKKQELTDTARDCLKSLEYARVPETGLNLKNKTSQMNSQLRIFSLNVHGWSNPTKNLLVRVHF